MKSLEHAIATAWSADLRDGLTSAIAVSGGPDSVAMLRAVAATQPPSGRLVALHFNHRLRGPASDADEAFVVQLGNQLGLEVLVGRSSRQSADSTRIEEDARRERYQFFDQAVSQCGARYLATAHTADDQIETILHRIVRGTGIAGLAGIPRVRRLTEACTLIRPLLSSTRAEVMAYLSELGQDFRVDATNALLDATRNRIRHELLPQLERYNARVRESLLSLGGLAGEAQGVIDALVDNLYEQCQPVARERQFSLNVAQLAGEPAYLVRELLIRLWREQRWPEQAMGAKEWIAMADLATGDGDSPATRMFPGNVTCQRDGSRLIVSRTAP